MDFETLRKNYSGKYIAILNNEEVVASGTTYNEVLNKTKDMKLVNLNGLSIRFIRPTKTIEAEEGRNAVAQEQK